MVADKAKAMKDRTIRLAQAYQKGQRALAELMGLHGGLARTWAMRFYRSEQCSTIDDLLQEARRGLIDAIGHYDPQRGAFSTVAVIWMRKRLLAHSEKAKQFGTQVDSFDEQVAVDSRPVRDYSILQKKAGRITRLANQGTISTRDALILRSIIATDEERDEILKPLFAHWHRQSVVRILARVRKAQEKVPA